MKKTEFMEKALEKFGETDYDFSLVPEEFLSKDKITVICPRHGEVSNDAFHHLKNQSLCRRDKVSKSLFSPSDVVEKFLTRAKEVYGEDDTYDYSRVVFTGNLKDNVEIGCKICENWFSRRASWHTSENHRCGFCTGRLETRDSFIVKAVSIHGESYDYSKVEYKGTFEPVELFCKKHGTWFWVMPSRHLTNEQGCPTCSAEKKQLNKAGIFDGSKTIQEHFLERAGIIHGVRYDYSKVEYGRNNKVPIIITCRNPEHGDFMQSPGEHLQGKGCAKCQGIGVVDTDIFIEQATAVHGNRYLYHKVDYSTSKGKVEIVCQEHGSFLQSRDCHIGRAQGCPNCYTVQSKAELELIAFIEELGFKVEQSAKVLNGKHIDVYIPEKKLGIEYNGLFWHSETYGGKRRSYHLSKTLVAEALGIDLIHIFEDEWHLKKDIVKGMLKSKLGKSDKGIGARKTTVKEILGKAALEFLDKHHLQGRCSVPEYCYGLFEGDELVSVLVLTVANVGPGEIEIIRFASSKSVVGGFSKLLAYFIQTHAEEFSSIVSFSDRRWSQGNLYLQSGFTKEKNTRPSYWWCKSHYKRINRRSCQKSKLASMLPNFDPELTEAENCISHNMYKVWDCGLTKWRLNL